MLMAIISRLTNNNSSGRRSFRLSPLEMLILGLILVVVFYLLSLWITGAFEAPKQVAPAAAPTELLDRALAATERAQARLLTIEKKLSALEDQIDKAGPGTKGKAVSNTRLSQRLEALEKKVATMAKASGTVQSPPKVDLTPLEARLLFLEKKVGEKSSKVSLDKRIHQLEQGYKQLSAAPAGSQVSSAELKKVEERLGKMEEFTAKIAKEQQKPAALPNEDKKLDERLNKLDRRLQQMAKAPERPAASSDELKKIEQRLSSLEKKSTPSAGTKVRVPQDIDDRLRKLEGTLKTMEPTEAHTSASVADMETRLQNLERTTPKAGAAAGVAAASLALMETRLHKIEAVLAQTSESLRKVHAPVTDPELISRLERLEKAIGAVKHGGDQKQTEKVNKLDKRLAEVDKRLVELGKAQALTSRHLAQVMEENKEPAQEARPSPPKAKEEKKPEKRAEKPEPKGRMITHTVRRGQTLYGIARRYGVKVEDIRRWNPKLKTRKNLWINEDLVIYSAR
jgi:LysM repeat protein